MNITAKMTTRLLEAERSSAGRKVELLEDVRHERPAQAIEYHTEYAIWHKCSAILAARRGDDSQGLGGAAWHQDQAARHLKLSRGCA